MLVAAWCIIEFSLPPPPRRASQQFRMAVLLAHDNDPGATPARPFAVAKRKDRPLSSFFGAAPPAASPRPQLPLPLRLLPLRLPHAPPTRDRWRRFSPLRVPTASLPAAAAAPAPAAVPAASATNKGQWRTSK